jgi:hypothetical protein
MPGPALAWYACSRKARTAAASVTCAARWASHSRRGISRKNRNAKTIDTSAAVSLLKSDSAKTA